MVAAIMTVMNEIIPPLEILMLLFIGVDLEVARLLLFLYKIEIRVVHKLLFWVMPEFLFMEN